MRWSDGFVEMTRMPRATRISIAGNVFNASFPARVLRRRLRRLFYDVDSTYDRRLHGVHCRLQPAPCRTPGDEHGAHVHDHGHPALRAHEASILEALPEVDDTKRTPASCAATSR